MSMPILVLILALLLAIFWLVRKRAESSQPTPKVKLRTRKGASEYHAVSIKLTDTACEPANEMRGRRFLATAAPKLPLPECDVPECQCRFVHYSDRRVGMDRRSPFAPGRLGGVSGVYQAEQRAGDDRRNGDNSD